MSVTISGGKLRRITRLSGSDGRFRMMAIDQRGSMQKAIQSATGEEATYEQVAKMKTMITRILSPNSTAVLTDPIFGYPYSIMDIPRDVGLLLAFEESGYVDDGVGENERASVQIENWNIEKAIRSGIDAIKLLIYYHPDASLNACSHQQDFTKYVGEQCEKYDLPFLLEFVCYSLDGESTNSLEFAKQKPDLVIRSVEEYTKPEYKVDILKVEFPANLKFVKEYKDRDFYMGASAYTLSEVEEFCRDLDAKSTLPWVILSAGVDIEEFIENVKISSAHGASGFLCGRAIWKDAVPLYPDEDAVTKFLLGEASVNFENSNAAVSNATPWFNHKSFGGLKNIELDKKGANWYEVY